MSKFCSIIENEDVKIGCTGQAVWVWDKNDTVLAKFKDLIYAYRAAISPIGDQFVVKGGQGRLAVYALKDLALIKKFRFSKVNCCQDDGFCFSRDGRYLLNAERQGDDLHSAISVYDTSDFSLASRTLLGESMMVEHIQEVDRDYYVLGFLRGADLVLRSRFVAKYANNQVCDVVKITQAESDFYSRHLDVTVFGVRFDDGRESQSRHTLRDLWAHYHKEQK